MAKDKSLKGSGTATIPSGGTGQAPDVPTGGQVPPPADATSAKTTPGQAPGGVENSVPKDKKLSKENKSLRDRLRAAEAAVEAAKKSQLSDAEKQAARLAELEAQALTWQQKEQEQKVKLAIVKSAMKRNLDPDLVERLINKSTIKFDEDGEPKGVGRALDAMLEQFPMLKGQPQQPPSIGATNPQRSSNGTATQGGDPLHPPRLSDTLPFG